MMGWIEQEGEEWVRLSKDEKDATGWARMKMMGRIEQEWEEWDELSKD